MEHDKVWKKTLEILTFWKEGKIVDTKKRVVSNGMTDDFVTNSGEINPELNSMVENWIKVRTQKYFLNHLDDVLKTTRDGIPVGENSNKTGWVVTIEDKRSLRDKFLDSTNDLWRDFRCLLETVGVVVKNSLILVLTPKMKQELREHDSESDIQCKS